MSRDWTFVPEYIQEGVGDWLKHYDKKMKSKRGFYASQSKKDMESLLHEAASIMKNIASEISYMESDQ
jgi:serine protease inhibitor